LPPVVETIDVQLQRTLLHLRSFALPIDRFIYLQSLKDRNETLFYRLAVDHLEEVMVHVTPTLALPLPPLMKSTLTAVLSSL
jgi:malate dehydrogenase (oxaloacetate-decarboxylating)(NADP+)